MTLFQCVRAILKSLPRPASSDAPEDEDPGVSLSSLSKVKRVASAVFPLARKPAGFWFKFNRFPAQSSYQSISKSAKSFASLPEVLSFERQKEILMPQIRTTNTSDPMRLYLFHWASQTDAQVFAQGWAFRVKIK